MKNLTFAPKNNQICFWLTLACFLLAMGFFFQFAHSQELSTNKILKVFVVKDGSRYSVDGMDIVAGKIFYSDNYLDYKGKYYNGRVLSFKGKDLGNFSTDSFSLVVCSDDFNEITQEMEGGCTPMDNGNILVEIPFFPNGKEAEIFDPEGKKIMTIDLTSKAVCNENNICDKPVEDNANCSSDCQVEKGYTMGNGTLENKDNLNQEGEPLTKKNSDWVWPLVKIFLVLITIPIIILIIFWWRKNRS